MPQHDPKALLVTSQAKHIAYLKERYAATLERERILLEQLAALQWQPITPENLPNRGDEALEMGTDSHGARVIPVGFDSREGDCERYTHAGFTHFRPINPPAPCKHEHPLRKMTNDGWQYWCGDCGVLIEHTPPAKDSQKGGE